MRFTQLCRREMDRLMRPVDASSLGAFRILFGLIMVWEVARYLYYNRVWRYYVAPNFYFTYELFPFVTPLPETGMYLVFYATALFALGITLGWFYRLSSVLFFVVYTYTCLLDKAQYNNHFYLISLLSLLLAVSHAHRWASLDVRQSLSRLLSVPFWQVLIFRAQMFIVYFYAGIAKLNEDWLRGEPMRTWLSGQIEKMSIRPDMILQYAHHVKRKLERAGIQSPIVRVEARASLNGRPYRPLVDPEANLAAEPDRILSSAPWILPLQ